MSGPTEYTTPDGYTFRRTLSGVWTDGDIEYDSLHHLQKATGKCLHDAEQTGITSSDFFQIFNGQTVRHVKVRILDEATDEEYVADADVVMEHKHGTHHGGIPHYEITGFINSVKDKVEKAMENLFKEIQDKAKTDPGGDFADHWVDSEWWDQTSCELQRYVAESRESERK